MKLQRMGFLLPLLCMTLFFTITSVHAIDVPTVRISEIQFNPIGSDTGQEFVELLNVSSSTLDISGWDLDPGALPYFTFPSSTILLPGQVLTVYLRKDGQQTVGTLFTGAVFGSTDMSNTKGMVALFTSSSHTSNTIVDYIEYGGAAQTHEDFAQTKGVWSSGQFFTVGTMENKSIQRICTEHALHCWKEQESTAGTTILVIPSQPVSATGAVFSGSGNTIPVSTQTQTGSTIEPVVIETVLHNTGALMPLNLPPIAVIRIQASGLNGGKAPFSLNLTGEDSTDDTLIKTYFWDYGDGYTFSGKNPLEHIYTVPGTYSVELVVADEDGATNAAILVITVTAVVPTGSSGINTSSNTTEQLSQTKQCVASIYQKSLVFSEIFPNPKGRDTGQEWIELFNPTAEHIQLCDLLIVDGNHEDTSFDLTNLSIPAYGYLTIGDETLGFTLGNQEGLLSILEKTIGTVFDLVSYIQAPEGKSYSRLES